MGKTFAEKVLAKKAGLDEVSAGEILEVSPDFAMSHDNTAAISKTFYKIGVDKVYDPDKHVVILDHCVPAASEKYAQNHKDIREFVQKQDIKNFFDVNCGICHQVLPENGFALPGSLLVGSDSHTTTYGAFGAFSAGIGRSELAVVMATGKIWLRVPETLKIIVEGRFPEWIGAKDLILKIIGDIGADGGLYRSVEFTGKTVQDMSLSDRMVLTNMAAEMGAKDGYVPPDEKVYNYLKSRKKRDYDPVFTDEDAEINETIRYDVSDLEAQIAFPHTVDNVKPVSEAEGIKVNQVVLGTCTNGRIEDLEIAASILNGRKVNPSVRMLVFAASAEQLKSALDKGIISTFVDSGAIIMNPGCGPCLGAHEGVLAPGEKALSTANRNFKGRMGCKEAEVYLGSPAVAAATAIAGTIIPPDSL